MKKIFLILLIFLFVFSVVVYSQEAPADAFDTTTTDTTADVATQDTGDLQPPYVMECVKVIAETDRRPRRIENVKFAGTCSSNNGCDVGVCRGNSCTVFDPVKDAKYFGGSGKRLPDVKVEGSNPHRFPSGDFKEKPLRGQIIGADDHTSYRIFAVWEPAPMGRGGEGEDPTQQLGQAKLVFPSDAKDCASVYWDPYGRVFDAISLEPLGEGEARVSLYDQAGNFVNTPSNNAIIDNLGKYNIYLEMDGMYTLKVDSMTNHDFVSVVPNPGYTKLYEKIFIAGNPAFAESKSNPQRYDIPVKPKSTPYHRDPEIVMKSQNIVWSNGEEFNLFNFRVSHPMTKVVANLPDGWVCEQTKSQYTDKEGFCLIRIKVADVPQEGVDLRFELDNIYYPLATKTISRLFDRIMSFFVKKVNAQQTIKIDESAMMEESQPAVDTTHFNPILRYIEGYAYDENGEAIPKAKVNVRLLNKSIFYTTTADDQGFFVIYKGNLPPLEFYLQFIDPRTGAEVVKTTSEFVKSNESYLTAERTNLMAGTKYDQPVIDPKTGKLNTIDKNYQPPLPTMPPEITKKSAFNGGIFLIVFILLVLFASLVGVVFYIKKTKISGE